MSLASTQAVSPSIIYIHPSNAVKISCFDGPSVKSAIVIGDLISPCTLFI